MEIDVVRRLRTMARHGVKRLAQGTGALPTYHRLRNARRLTVLTFHRVLARDDQRRADADPEWTLTVDELAPCVAFAKLHYNVISLDQLLDARRRGGCGAGLPPRPLLLTFDDGWADNEEHALPVLEAARVPAVIFVSGDAVGRDAPFWREALRAAWLGCRIDESTWHALWTGASGATGAAGASGASGANATTPAPVSVPARTGAALEHLIEKMSDLATSQREALLAPLESRLADGRRHMLSTDQLLRLRDRGVAIGAHGRTHEPLPRCEDLDDELLQPRRRLGELTGEPITTLALPHSRFTPEVLRRAARAGYELVFTGEPQLAPVSPVPFAIGRIPITPGDIIDARGRFRTERLALHLFRRRHVSAWL